MCRYGHQIYKPHYVCFDCRKTFKRRLIEDIIMHNGDWEAYKSAYLNRDAKRSENFRENNPKLIERFEKQYRNNIAVCPECNIEMYNIGKDFKAPKKHKIREWEIVRSMYKLGKTFHTCGCDGLGYIPQKSSDYLNYLLRIKSGYQQKLRERNKDFSESELKEYLDYWTMKLEAVSSEIIKIQ